METADAALKIPDFYMMLYDAEDFQFQQRLGSARDLLGINVAGN